MKKKANRKIIRRLLRAGVFTFTLYKAIIFVIKSATFGNIDYSKIDSDDQPFHFYSSDQPVLGR